ELATCRLRIGCSTTELPRLGQKKKSYRTLARLLVLLRSARTPQQFFAKTADPHLVSDNSASHVVKLQGVECDAFLRDSILHPTLTS
ncbi:MAG: hypothetical protein ABLQ96_06405, partial [Candidatus Acidiferrum sp.]